MKKSGGAWLLRQYQEHTFLQDIQEFVFAALEVFQISCHLAHTKAIILKSF